MDTIDVVFVVFNIVAGGLAGYAIGELRATARLYASRRTALAEISRWRTRRMGRFSAGTFGFLILSVGFASIPAWPGSNLRAIPLVMVAVGLNLYLVGLFWYGKRWRRVHG